MKRTGFLYLIGLVILSGCAHQYVMTLTNGTRITSSTKPRLVHGAYYYKDSNGREMNISAGRVREIAPASMVKEEKSMFGAPRAK